MKKPHIYYFICLLLYFISVILLFEMAKQPVRSVFEAVVIFIPSLLNVVIIIYSLIISNIKTNFDGFIKKAIFLIFYIIVLITFSVSVIIIVLLYLDITPSVERFF